MAYDSPYRKVGIALGKFRSGRQDEYGIYEMANSTTGDLYVRYEGYREGFHMYGLPMGGPMWQPPIAHLAEKEFALTGLNWQHVAYFDGREGGFGINRIQLITKTMDAVRKRHEGISLADLRKEVGDSLTSEAFTDVIDALLDARLIEIRMIDEGRRSKPLVYPIEK